MRNILKDFKFMPDGITSLADALCGYLKREIAFGRIKGGDKLPTIAEMSEETGLSFSKSRGVMERLEREGYAHPRPRVGTLAVSHGENVLRGRVLFAMPDVDSSRFFTSHMINILRREIINAGYEFAVVTFPLDENENLFFFERELLRATDLVIAARPTPKVQERLAVSGIGHFFIFGDKPMSGDSPWIRFAAEIPLAHFASHCAKTGVKNVLQVRFEGYENVDAQRFLEGKGIGCSEMVISYDDDGKGRFDVMARRSYETFVSMPRGKIPELLLFVNSFLAQGAIMAFLERGVRVPEDVKVVSFTSVGSGLVCPKSITRIECDPVDAGEKVAGFALAVLAKGRIPRPPKIAPQYVFGETFPF